MGGLENLGVEGGPKAFETANVQHYRQLGRDNEAFHRAISKAMAYSQLVYEALGVTHVYLYRGTKTAPVQGAHQGKKIQTTTARELASFSIDPSVAYTFAGADKRVVRYRVPVSRLFVSPLTYGPLSSAMAPHSENEYAVVGQDGMEGKVMPKNKSDFSAEKMKLASEEEEDDDAPLIIAFSDFEDDWLRPGVVDLWWNAEEWQRDHEVPLFRIGRRLLAFAREHAGFRRELIASLQPRRASFSVFDTPEDVEKKRSPSYGKMTFESWYERRYDGGKKKVKNPNPKTSKQYPEVAVSTAMKDETFAAKIYAEYQQEMQEAQSKPKAPEPPPEPEGKITAPSDVKKGDKIRYQFKGKEYIGVVTQVGDDKFQVKVYDPKTGARVSKKEPSFTADDIKDRKVERADDWERPPKPEQPKPKSPKQTMIDVLDVQLDMAKGDEEAQVGWQKLLDKIDGDKPLSSSDLNDILEVAGDLYEDQPELVTKVEEAIQAYKGETKKPKNLAQTEAESQADVKTHINHMREKLNPVLEAIQKNPNAAQEKAKALKDEIVSYLTGNYHVMSDEQFLQIKELIGTIDVAMVGNIMKEIAESQAQVKKTIAEWSDKIDAAKEAKDPKKLRKVVEDTVAFLKEHLDPKKHNQAIFKALFDKLQAIDPSEIKISGSAEVLDIDSGDFTQVGPQTGSNPGGLYEGSDGSRYYVKTPQTEDRGRNEILAGRLYEMAGIDVPELSEATREGKFSVASKIIPGLKSNKAKLKSGEVPGVVEGIAVDAWLGNWDVVGLEYDNLLVDKDGRAHRVDTGGALRYRAMGEPKGDKFGPEVNELETFTDKSRRAGGVLGHATPEQIVESIDRVLKIPETKIRSLVHQWGPKDEKEREKFLETLLARRESLRKQREKYAEKTKTATKIAKLALQQPAFRQRLLAEVARLS
jgi:hypothetical protein